MIGLGHWYACTRSDPRLIALYRRHYSRKRYRGLRPLRQVTGPGETMCLLTPAGDAAFIWRYSRYRRDGQQGAECSLFRNESPVLSSVLIAEACALAWLRWPGLRLFTYVDPARIRSTNPGFCFLMAGFRRCGRSRGGLVLLERFPEGNGGREGGRA